VLNPKVRVIQGDGVNLSSIGAILEVLKANKISAENVAFGMGGGLLQQITFKKFTQSKPLPTKAIVLLTNKCEACAGKVVNIGTFTSFKEYNTHLAEPFVAEPPAEGGVPLVGSDPLPESAYAFNKYEATGWGEYQPVFKIEVK